MADGVRERDVSKGLSEGEYKKLGGNEESLRSVWFALVPFLSLPYVPMSSTQAPVAHVRSQGSIVDTSILHTSCQKTRASPEQCPG